MDQPVEDILEENYREFVKIPAEVHLLCPKVHEDDYEEYDDLNTPGDEITALQKKQRVEEWKARLNTVYWTSLLLAYGKDKAGVWLEDWGNRMAINLHNCDKCVLNWHMHRKKYLSVFAEKWPEDAVAGIENCLHRFDFDRIDKGLEWAKGIIENVEAEGRIFSRTDLGEDQGAVLLTVYEALCCMAYLSLPAKRQLFQHVFVRLSGKKPMKLGENVLLPAMTQFLFGEDKTRLQFAEKSYERLRPKSLTQEQFNWAVHDNLAQAMNSVAQLHPKETTNLPEIERFWRAVNWIVKALDEQLILHGIRGMEVTPSLYDLLFLHMQCESEAILLLIIQALTALLTTSPQAFWDTIGDARPFVVVEQVIAQPLFKLVLSQSLTFAIQSTDADGREDTHSMTTSWINTWIQSLKRNHKSDACEQLLHLLFEQIMHDANIGEQGKAACIRAGLDALDHVLRSFAEPTLNVIAGTTSVYINSMLNVTLKYKDVINDAAETKSHAQHTLGVPRAAMSVIQAALHLDSRTTVEEHLALRKNEDAKLQKAITRNSAALWDGFMENLYSGQTSLAKIMLVAMAPLINVERFRPPRKDLDRMSKERKDFNTRFAKIAEVLGNVMQRLCGFTVEELKQLCLEGHAIRPIIALTVHGEEEIRSGSAELIKTITETSSRSDALTVLLERNLNITLSSMIFATRRIMDTADVVWGPARHIINTAKDVLKALSDLSTGILRSKTLDSGEANVVTGWWSAHWKYIEVAFGCTAGWSHQVDIQVMQDFCRDVIELADVMVAQDGLFASALQTGHGSAQPQELSKLQLLMKEPQRYLNGIVRMLRLRDLYLVEVTVKVVAKLLTRLRENEIEIPKEPKIFVQDSCIKNATGRYTVSTNMSDQQRAELLKALGEEEDEIEIVQINTIPKAEKPKKQSLLDAWSKSATSTPQTSRTNKHDVLELSSSVDKNKTILEKMAARQKPLSGVSRPTLTGLRSRVEPVTSQVSTSALIESRKKAKAEKLKKDAEIAAQAKALRGELVVGEGSGLKGLSGVVGKEHAAQKSQIMVDSDEEEEDDSEDEDLKKLISKGQQGQKAHDEATRRRERALLEKTRGPVKKVKVQRSAKDMRARLIPPMDQLHQAILEWDIFHAGNDPPAIAGSIARVRVSDSYEHPQLYKQTFLSLLLSEAWQSFVTSKDETTSKSYGLKIASRMNVDKFLEVTASIPSAENKERMLSEGDIILLSRGTNPLTDSSEPHALARIWKTSYKKDRLEVTYRLNSKNNQLLAGNALGVGSELQAVKITNMTTIEREYAALESLQYYDLMNEVLSAQPSPILKYSDEAVHSVMQNYQLNPGQAKAILGAKDNDGFTLIQGPPGTGKTKTIVAMVGSLLTGNIQPLGTAIRPKLPGQSNQPMPKKLLVCAPSNAAVDELVLRLKQGVKTMTGSFHKINVLRLGRSDAINAAVRDVTLDELVKKRLEGDNTQNKAKEERDKMHNDAAKIRDELAEIRPRLDEARANGDRNLSQALQRSVDQLRRAQINIGSRIDEEKASGNTATREAEIRRRQVQQEILDGAQVLCATLSGSGHEMFKNLNIEFETVIIDEAAQCVELSALIPLKYGCTKCILVGDPKQLPPTVLSQSAAKFGYDQSLFVRMQRNHPDSIHMLDRQYRMHPEISLFPSLEFYEGKLVDGDDMSGLRQQPWHASALLGPYRFFDVEGTQTKGNKGRSLVNHAELNVAMKLYDRFRADFGRQCDIRGKIGIITPYKAQLQELRYQFSRQYGEGITEDIEFNTTDAFQGRECEIIIFSCVRATTTGGIGFMKDIRRMNVGLTRAKSSLWILGDSRALCQGEFWNKLIENARQRSLYTKGDIMSMLSKPSSMTPLPPTSKPVPAQMKQPPSKELDIPDAGQPPRPYKAGPTSGPTADHRNERTRDRSDRPPVIQTSTKQESKKRPSDASDAQRGPKRMTTEQNRPSTRPPPTGPRAMNSAPKEPKQAKDPSAMVALGLTPAARPPAIQTGSTSRPSSSSSPATHNHNLPPKPPGQNGTVIHRKKPKADPFIQRKPPRR